MSSWLGFSSVGFAGARSGVGTAQAAPLAAAAAAAGCQLFATCGRGVPAAAAALPGTAVFRRQFPGRAAFAARAVQFVRALAASPAPALLVWPGRPAPAAAVPGRRWASCGSGSWSEAALAAGLGVNVFVFLSGSQPPASRWPGRWQAVCSGPLAGSWQFVPAARQAALF